MCSSCSPPLPPPRPLLTLLLLLLCVQTTYTDESAALRTALCKEAGLTPGSSSPEDAEKALGLMMKNKAARVKELLREQGCLDLTSRLMVAELDELAARLGVVEDKVEEVEGTHEPCALTLTPPCPLNHAP